MSHDERRAGEPSLIHAIVMKMNRSILNDTPDVPKCTVVMPVYMPNERAILHQSLDMLSNLSSAGEHSPDQRR